MPTQRSTQTQRPTLALRDQEQSLWLDYIRRSLLTGGELSRLIEKDGLRGLTSNPSIFQKAIGETDEYDQALHKLLSEDGNRTATELYEYLVIDDIKRACDILRPIYEEFGNDGFVSLEVSPHLAHDTEGTIEEARRLWEAVSRPNLMIKVPATDAGIPAIERLLAEGININVTLMFSLEDYEKVAHAYLRGVRQADDPSRVHSVASFFVSRLSVKIDDIIENRDSEPPFDGGDVAIANAKLAYQRFREIFQGDGFTNLKEEGAHVQRPLWASTSTKNPTYSDVRYVEALIGPNTVNTVPPRTLNAFRDHGRVERPTILKNVDEAAALIDRLPEYGLDLNQLTDGLQEEGIDKFVLPFDRLLNTIREKCNL